MKKLFLLLAIGSVLTSCSKKNSPEPPTPNSDATYAKDAITSYQVMNDVFVAVAEARDTYTYTPFFGSATIKKDTVAKIDSIIFNNSHGADGNIRSGKIVVKYNTSTLNAKYIRQPGFKSTVQLINYVINTSTVSATSISINNSTSNGFNPNTANLTWAASYSGFTINNGSSSVVSSANHVVALLNTSTNAVYAPSGNLPINWSYAKVAVSGNGSVSDSKGSFDITLDNTSSTYLVRDFAGCAPETILKPGKHPFINGIMSIKPSGANTQTINMGSGTCDYNITLTIDGISYQVDVE